MSKSRSIWQKSEDKVSKRPKRPKPTQMPPPPSGRSREEVLAGFYDDSGERRGLPLARILLRILEVLVDIRDRIERDDIAMGNIVSGRYYDPEESVTERKEKGTGKEDAA